MGISKASKRLLPKQSMVLFVRLGASGYFNCGKGGICN